MSKTDDLIEHILNSLNDPDYIQPADIPNINLYMDQVTTFMDTHLERFRRNPEDKILTKTMINNYAKNDLLPPPEKKKYSKDHILILIFIYYFKGILSIGDIQKVLRPLTTDHFHSTAEPSLDKIYQTVVDLEKDQLELLKDNLKQLSEQARNTFTDIEDKDTLQAFSLICLLSFDVYMKKKIIEQMIDELLPPDNHEKTDKKKEKKEKPRPKSTPV